MGGSSVEDDWEFTSPLNGSRTLVLVGRTGAGKSATGNTILGSKAFKSKTTTNGVTTTCEMKTTVLNDGQIVNVIDTPGLFDVTVDSDFIIREIVKCISMAKDGIHAILVVLSVRNRFSKEEEAAINSLRTLFGSKIDEYMIVVFTNGDVFEDDEETLEDYIRDCAKPLKETLRQCGNRWVLFDNKSKSGDKREEQVQELLSLVDTMLAKNGGKPYSHELFVELKKGTLQLHKKTEEVESLEGYSKQEISELTKQLQRSYQEQLKRITEMVESRLKETASRLETQLAEEQAARLKAEEKAYEAQKKSNDEIRQLRENLERAQKETEALRKRGEVKCAIL